MIPKWMHTRTEFRYKKLYEMPKPALRKEVTELWQQK